MIMSIKDKIINIITKHPKAVTLGIGLVTTFAIGTILGMIDHSQAFAYWCSRPHDMTCSGRTD